MQSEIFALQRASEDHPQQAIAQYSEDTSKLFFFDTMTL